VRADRDQTLAMKNNPYANAARLPDGEAIAVGDVIPGDGKVLLEIGSGRGAFALAYAALHPEVRFLAFEIRRKHAAQLAERFASREHVNARCFANDAREALKRLVPDASIDAVAVHFPDPWWKKRHEKRLVMGASLLDSIARLLRDGGELFVQTDVEERAQQYEAQIATHPALEPAGDTELSPRLLENPYQARSPREHRAIADGLPVHRLRYRRRARA
jgi:tRNA (guanine-N7-)-methyltransferase